MQVLQRLRAESIERTAKISRMIVQSGGSLVTDEDIARAEEMARVMRGVVAGMEASWRKEARRPSVRLRRAWRALRG